ncbi:c-type cytochrome [Terriglobus roseus]|uniref:c-type cytochrome n=1 Tax=Terriglobus roseus TaxID=392734 RepID=UPI00147B043D|nr:c-type cytochrome [Terriglobus roseus]
MKRKPVLAVLMLSVTASLPAAPHQSLAQAAPTLEMQYIPADALPAWAYPTISPALRNAGGTASQPAKDEPRHVPGSAATYTGRQIPDLFTVPDWFPQEHAPMPASVADGRKPDVPSCGHCHLPNGLGRPENASVAGLSERYILEQMEDFKAGARKSSDPRMASVAWMIRLSKNITPEEAKSAAAYFAGLKLTKWIRVVETDRVPLTEVDNLMLVVTDPKKMEPIGNRVIEVSEDFEQTELRNPHSGFIAYVPKGSLMRGRHLVRTASAAAPACTQCHGANLKGTTVAPPIAGRSPSQMTRQLIDFQRGNRNGAGAAMMKASVAKLTTADMVAITGYLASLQP